MRPGPLCLFPLLLAACSSSSDDAAQPPVTQVRPDHAAQATTPEPEPTTGLFLQALVATSGADAAKVLDGDAGTGWRPRGDPENEGLLLRFEQPVRVLEAKVQLCADSGAATIHSYLDGSDNTLTRVNPGGFVKLPWRGGVEAPAFKSLFLRAGSVAGALCVAEVALTLPPEVQGPVRPPRSRVARVEASSVLEPADAYHPGYLFDGRTDFGWVEGAEGLGVGEELTLSFKSPVKIAALEVWNGYQRSEDHFKKNARLSSLTLNVDSRPPVTLQVADTMGPQRLELPEPVSASRLRLGIAGAVPGSRYEDLVISELRLHDAQGALSVATPDLGQRQKALQEQVAGELLSQVVDKSWTGFCDDSETLKLRSNHSFVHYSAVAEGPDDSVREVFDGAWVVDEQGPGTAGVQLYGRRHRTETSWRPYGDDQVSSSIRIAGGRLELWLHSDALLQKTEALVDEPAFNQAKAWCLTEGAHSAALQGRELLVISGGALSGLYIQN